MNTKVFFEGKIRSVSEATALLVKLMIEVDLVKKGLISEDDNCYSYISRYLNKSESAVRKWTYDWNTKSGRQIPTMDFFILANLTKSEYALRFFEALTDQSADETKKEHSQMIETIGIELVSMGKKFIGMSEEKNKNNN